MMITVTGWHVESSQRSFASLPRERNQSSGSPGGQNFVCFRNARNRRAENPFPTAMLNQQKKE
jgi:hypothetical protein